MLKMSPRSKIESPTCDYEKKTKTEKGHFKTPALSGECNDENKEVYTLDVSKKIPHDTVPNSHVKQYDHMISHVILQQCHVEFL